MAEPDKRQIGDGSDNYGEAAKQMAKAAKEAGIETAKQAAVKGAEAGANAAAATVQAGVEGGKAVAEIAAGTAAGGPWGAILSAAWAMRHTLFKILVCICLFFLVIIVLIVSLPSVVTNSVFGLDGSMVDMENPTTLLESYNHLAADISAVVEEGYDAALAKVEQIIEDGGYDYDLSMDALINYAQGSAGYDVSYILAAYSASLQQRNTGKEDMLAKLRSVADSMFPVAFVEKESEQIVPFTYATYRPVTVTVVTSKTQTGTINGVPQYRYTTARRTYYEPDETITTSEPVNVAAYTPVVVSVPIYSGGRITGTRSETYYEQDGNETLTPETEVVKYVECTIQPFDNSVIIRAFGIDPSATYDQFKITYGEAIQKMANALKMTLYGTLGNGQMVPLTDAELIAFVNAQSCSPMRKHILTTALSLVGKVPYFWGGKSAPGWNDAWNTPRLVTSAGSPTTGTIRPFLSSLFFSFLFIKLVRYADSTPELRCKVPVNLIFDEFNNVGKLGGAADGSDFARTLSVIRSRAIYVMLAVQSLGQLQNRYPNNLWAEIVGNLDVQLMLGCTDEVSAEYFSARSGDMSVEINSTMTVRKTIAVAQVIPQYRQTEGQGRRRLLTPDEVLRIPNEELLVVIRGHNVLKLKKFDYADHPLAKELTPVSILDYTPPHAAAPFLQTETTSPHAASEERPHTSSIPSKRRTLYSSAKPPSEF